MLDSALMAGGPPGGMDQPPAMNPALADVAASHAAPGRRQKHKTRHKRSAGGRHKSRKRH